MSRNIRKPVVPTFSRFKDYICVKISLTKVTLNPYRYTKPQDELILKNIKVSGKLNEFLPAVNILSILNLFGRTSYEFRPANSCGINAENLTHTQSVNLFLTLLNIDYTLHITYRFPTSK